MEVNCLTEATAWLLQHKVVLFDLDDTLYSEKEYVRSGYTQIARRYPDIPHMAEKLWTAFENGEKAIDFVLTAEGKYSEETVRDCLNIYRFQHPDIALYPEARELITLLKNNGVKLGLITDGRPEGQRAKIEALGIAPLFDHIIITDELGGIPFRKPNPTAFEKMQQFFGVPYAEMVYVGDNPNKDFTAPKTLGMRHVFFKNPDGLYSCVKGEKCMKKVLFVANVLSHIEAFHLPYLSWFKSHGYEVHVMANAQGKTADYCDKLYDVAIERSPFNLKNIAAIRQAKRIIDSEQYEVIHSHTPMGGVVGRLASMKARKNGTKILYTAHGFHFYKGAPKRNWLLYFTMEKLLARFTDCIVTINTEDFEHAKRYFASKKTAVEKIDGIGVNVDRFAAVSDDEKALLKREYGYEDKFLLIYAAEFIPRKNHRFFVDAAVELCARCPNVKFLFCGKGALLEQTEGYANEKGVSAYIDFLGFRKDMPLLYKMSDVLISASIEEGFGINVIEGMAAGLPAVVSVVRGHKEMVMDGENGYFFYADSVSEFVEHIAELNENTAQYMAMSAAAKETAKQFSIDHSLSQMETIYQKFIG